MTTKSRIPTFYGLATCGFSFTSDMTTAGSMHAFKCCISLEITCIEYPAAAHPRMLKNGADFPSSPQNHISSTAFTKRLPRFYD